MLKKIGKLLLVGLLASNLLLSWQLQFDFSKQNNSSVQLTASAQVVDGGGTGKEGTGKVENGLGTCVIRNTLDSSEKEPELGVQCCDSDIECTNAYNGILTLGSNEQYLCKPGLECANSQDPNPYVVVEKFAPTNAASGDEITYSLIISNIGTVATTLNLSDNFPAEFAIGGTSTGTIAGQSLLVPNIILNPFTSLTIFVTGGYNQVGSFENTFFVLGLGTIPGSNCVTALGNTTCTSNTVKTQVDEYDTTITKTIDDTSPEVGDIITYDITVKNDGSTPINKTITDSLDDGYLNFISASPSLGSYIEASNDVTRTITGLAVGASATLTVTAQVILASTPVPILNTAIMLGDSFEGMGLSNPVSFISHDAGLSLTKSVAPATGWMNDSTFTYTIAITNNSAYPFVNVDINDQLPSTFVPSGVLPSFSNLTINPGTNLFFTIPGTFNSGSASGIVFTNTATITAGDKDANGNVLSVPFCHPGSSCTDSETVTVFKKVPKMVITKTSSGGPLEVGDSTIYTITVSNQGQTPLTGITLTDALPAGFTVATNTLPVVAFNLAVGTTNTYTVSGTWTSAGAKLNIITGDTLNGTDCSLGGSLCFASTVDMITNRGLVISKTSNPITGAIGDYIKYTITITNQSKFVITGITVEDILPAQYIGAIVDPSQGYFQYTGYTRYALGLNPAQSATLVFTGYFTGEGTKINTGLITSGYKLINNQPFYTGYCTICSTEVTTEIIGFCDGAIQYNNNYSLKVFAFSPLTSQAIGQPISYEVFIMNIGSAAFNGTVDHMVNAELISTDSIGIAPGGIYHTTITTGEAPGGSTYGAIIASSPYIAEGNPTIGVGPSTLDNEQYVFKKLSNPAPIAGAEANYGVFTYNNSITNHDAHVLDVLPSLYHVTDTITQSAGDYDQVVGYRDIGALPSYDYGSLRIEGYYDIGNNQINQADLYIDGGFHDSATANGAGGGSSQCDLDGGLGGPGGGVIGSTTTDLWIIKTGSITTFIANNTPVVYTLSFANSGFNLNNNVTITDYLPAGFIFTGALLDASPNFNRTYTTATNLFQVTGLSLGIQQTGSITIYGFFSGSFVSGQALVNTATIYYFSGGLVGPETTYTNNTGTHIITYLLSGGVVNGWATGVSLTKTVTPLTGTIGQVFTFTITVTNTGIYTSSGLQVNEFMNNLIGSGFTGISFQASTGTINTGTRVWTIPLLAPNQSANLIFSGYFTSTGTKVNVATLSGCLASNGCTGVATGFVVGSGLLITKTVNATGACVGELVTYTLTVINQGILSHPNVSIVDTLPAGFVVVSSGVAGASVASGSAVSGRTVGNFGTSSMVFTIVGFFTTTGVKTNTGMISGCNTTGCISVNTGIIIINDPVLCPLSGIIIDKSISNAVASVGQIISYLIVIQNLNPYTIYDIYAQENLPIGSGFTGITRSASTGSFDTGTQVRYVPGLGSGASANLTISGYFTSTGVKLNTVLLSGCAGSGCSDFVTGLVTEQVVTGQCGILSGFIALYGTGINGTSQEYCSGGTFTGFTSATGFQSWFCEGLNGGATVGPCTLSLPSCGDGIVQSGSEACDSAIPLTGNQLACTNTCNTLTVCTSTGGLFGGNAAIDPNNPSTVNGVCCGGLVGVPLADPNFLPDIQSMCVVPTIDLALSKTIPGGLSSFISGAIVTFDFTIYNQGTLPQSSLQIIDYIPSGLGFISGQTGWTLSGSNAVYSGYHRIGGGQSVTVSLQLLVNGLASGSLSNGAELLAVTGDIDSTPDNNPNNDCNSGSNNFTGGLGTTGGALCDPAHDEDDHDTEIITIVNSGSMTGLVIDPYACAGAITGSFSGSATGSSLIISFYSGGVLTYQFSPVVTGNSFVVPIEYTNIASPWYVASGVYFIQYSYFFGNTLVTGGYTTGITNQCSPCPSGYTFSGGMCVLTSPYLLSISKVGPNQPMHIIGQDILYLIHVSNTGQTATGVRITDTLPNGFALDFAVMNSLYSMSSIQPQINGNTIIRDIPSISGGQTITLFVYGQFTPSHGVGSGTNTAVISSGFCITCTGIVTNRVDICGPEGYLLSITKTGNRTTGLVFDTRNYTINVSSIGYATASNIPVAELFPSDFVLTSYSVSKGVFVSNTGSATGLRTIISLPPNTNATLNISGYYTSSGVKINTVTIQTGCAMCNPNPTALWTGVVGAYPYLLTIDKSSSTGSLVAIGQHIIYALDVHNYGPQVATSVVVTDTLPNGMVPVRNNALINSINAGFGNTFTYNTGTNTITRTIPSIPVNGTVRLLFSGYPTIPGILTNTGIISTGLCLSGCVDTDTKTVDICGPEGYLLKIDKVSSRGSGTTGYTYAPLAYTITLTNTGYKLASGVTISDLLPSGFTGISASASVGSFNTALGVRTLSIGTGQTATLTITGHYTSSGTKTNTATITSGICLPGQCASSVTNYLIDVPYNLIINKSASVGNVLSVSGFALINDPITYTITVTNVGPETGTNIVVSELIPSGFVFSSFIPYQVSTGTFNTGTLIRDIPSLAVGQSETLILLGQYTTHGIKTNLAVITSGRAFNKTGSTTLTVLPCNGVQCIQTGICNATYQAQTFTGTANINTGLLCSGGILSGLNALATGWTWNCLAWGSGASSYGCYLNISTGTTILPCGGTGQSICGTGMQCMTGLVNQDNICLTGCNANYMLSGTMCIATGFDLGITKSLISGSLQSGQLLTYQLSIYNNGPARTDLSIRDEFPSAYLIYSGVSYSGISFNTGSTLLTPFSPGGYPNVVLRDNMSISGYTTGVVTIQFIVSGSAASGIAITNTGGTYGLVNGLYTLFTGEANTGNNFSSVTLYFTPDTGTYLTISKTPSVTNPTINSNLTWNIIYSVIGTGVLYNVSLVDVLPSVFTFVSATTGYTYTGGVLSYNLGNLTGSATGGILTGLISVVTTVNTGAITGQTYINTITGTASGLVAVATGMITVYNPTPVYSPGGGGPYIQVPLPTPAEEPVKEYVHNVSPDLPETVVTFVKKTRMLAIRGQEALGEYIPFYTQPTQTIKENIYKMPDTGVYSRIQAFWEWIYEMIS